MLYLEEVQEKMSLTSFFNAEKAVVVSNHQLSSKLLTVVFAVDIRLAQGKDNRKVESSREAKSISSEQTFATDINDKNILLNVLLNQVEDVAQRLRTNDLEAKTITLKLRYDDFRTITRSNTFEHPTNTTKTLWQEAEAIFLKWHKKSAGAIRLLGFGASGLHEAGSGQHQLFSEPDHDKQKRLDEAFDRIREKFGHDALRRGK